MFYFFGFQIGTGVPVAVDLFSRAVDIAFGVGVVTCKKQVTTEFPIGRLSAFIWVVITPDRQAGVTCGKGVCAFTIAIPCVPCTKNTNTKTKTKTMLLQTIFTSLSLDLFLCSFARENCIDVNYTTNVY